VTIQGAEHVASGLVAVDLEHDHRVDQRTFKLRTRQDSQADELVTEGERIQVAVTASGFDSTLVERWSAAMETGWDTKPDDKAYNRVFQYFGIKRSADVNYADGNNGVTVTAAYAEYRTDDAGAILQSGTSVCNPMTVEVMDDLPLYEGYSYTAMPPTPTDSSAVDGLPRRRKPDVYVRTASNRYITDEEFGDGCNLSIDADGIWVRWSGDNLGLRRLDGTAIYNSTTIDWEDMVLTIGLKLPMRVSLRSAISGTVRKRRVIRLPDLHLWIGHPGCIWALDTTSTTAAGDTAKRIPDTITGSVVGSILRDDRAALARAHALAWNWYRSDSGRVSVHYELRACGLLPSFRTLAGDDTAYPQLGQVLSVLDAAGQTSSPGTPFTRIEYDNTRGVTRFDTDWTELDYA
jgi:hypothetical protein